MAKWPVKWQIDWVVASVYHVDNGMVQLKTIFKSFHAMEAQMITARLRTAGFQATVLGELAALSTEGGSLATGGIRIQVPAAEEGEARALVDGLLNHPPEEDSPDRSWE